MMLIAQYGVWYMWRGRRRQKVSRVAASFFPYKSAIVRVPDVRTVQARLPAVPAPLDGTDARVACSCD